MSDALHPLVAEYLARFDDATPTSGLPGDRVAELRREIMENLGAAIPVGTSHSDASAVLDGFGAPAELFAQAADVADAEPVGSRQARTRVLVTGAVVVIVIALVLTVVLPIVQVLAR